MLLSPYIFIDIRHIPLHVSLTHNPQYMQINIPIATPLNFRYYHYIEKNISPPNRITKDNKY